MADHGGGDEYSGRGDPGYGGGYSGHPNQGGGDQHSGGADLGYGGGYSGQANQGGGDQHSGGTEYAGYGGSGQANQGGGHQYSSGAGYGYGGEYSGGADHAGGGGYSGQADQVGAFQYSEGIDHAGGGGYSGQADQVGAFQYSGGIDHAGGGRYSGQADQVGAFQYSGGIDHAGGGGYSGQADQGGAYQYSGVADHAGGGGYSRQTDQVGAFQYSGGADHAGGGGYSGQADQGGASQYSGGADHAGGDGYSGQADQVGAFQHSGGADPAYGGGYSGGVGDGYGPRPIEGPRPPTFDSNSYVPTTPKKLTFPAKLIIPIIIALALCLFYPLYIPINIIYISITGDTSGLLLKDYIAEPSDVDKDGRIVPKRPDMKVKVHHLTILTMVRMGCLVSIWMVINLSVPSLKSIPLLGSHLWRWTLLAALALLGYPILFILYVFTHGLRGLPFTAFRGSNVEYCVVGLAQSAILVMYFTIILVVWLLCVDTSNAPLRMYGSMTVVSFLVGAVLCVVKSVVLLWWKTKLIYRKYEGKILSAGCQLYIYLLFTVEKSLPGSHQLVAWRESMDNNPQPSAEAPENYEGRAAVKRRKILPVEEYMLKKNVSLEYIHEVATYLTNNFELTLTEDDEVPDAIPSLRQRFAGLSGQRVTLSLGEFNEELLRDLIKEGTSKEGAMSFREMEKWMINGLRNCYAVGNIINGAMDAMRLLDRVLTGLIALVVALVWIFVTGFATTSVVVGLASMFLGLSFVFGDTCKTFFQGVIFAFVTRPFDVGDRCIIDDKELKVKKINILTTTFFGSQSKEIVIYPNSDLSIKYIVVLLHGERVSESEPKPHGIPGPQLAELEDVIELILPCATKALQIKSLRRSIEGYLQRGVEYGYYKKPYRVILKEVGESIKMVVHFHHNLNNGNEGDSYETPAIRKENQRSEFLLHLKELQENIENEV